MIERILETEVMDTSKEATEYDSMDHSEVNRQFVTDLLAVQEITGEILDLGTGTARIPIAMCHQNREVHIVAVDMSESMLDAARINVQLSGYKDRILLDRQDAKSLEYTDNRFDAVVSNSIVHHLPEPSQALAEAVRVVVAGGMLFFRDLLRPMDEALLDFLVATYAGEESSHAQQMFFDSLHAALTLDEIRAMVADFGFDPQTVQATSDRHWTWIGHQEK